MNWICNYYSRKLRTWKRGGESLGELWKIEFLTNRFFIEISWDKVLKWGL